MKSNKKPLKTESYKTMLKEIKEDLSKGRYVSFSCMRRFTIKIAILSKLIYEIDSIKF